MILPFVTIGSKIFFCSLADRHRAYRSFFIVFLLSALVGYGSFGVLPFFIEPQPPEAGLNHKAWAFICAMTSIATISMSVISCLSDAFAMNSSKKNNTSYGLIRLWGTLGWGASSFVLAFINQSSRLPYLVPGLIMTIVLISLDIIIACIWPNRDDFKLNKSCSNVEVEDVVTVLSHHHQQEQQPRPTDDEGKTNANGANSSQYGATQSIGLSPSKTIQAQKQTSTNYQLDDEPLSDISSVSIQWMLFKEVAGKRRSIFRYMILFTISGALISLQWSYFFLYLEKLYTDDSAYISGLSMVGQSLLGELPFFLISDWIVRTLGRSHTLSVSISSIGLRYLLYQYLLPNASMYCVFLTEPFQGPNFGLFYVVMTEVGLDYSDCEEAIVSTVEKGIVENDAQQIQKLRQALRATMQSVMSACYEGLGLGIGSIIGGLVIDYYGFETLWLYSAITAMTLGLLNLLIDVFNLPVLVDKKPRIILKV